MSLEDRIEALTAAVERNSNILEAGLKRTQGAAPGKPAAVAGKPAATKPATRRAAAPTEEDIRTHFGGYLATKDKAEKEQRKSEVRAILDHFGAGLASEIAEENRAEAIGYIKQLVAGETPDFMNEDAGEEDSGAGLL
jgi:hypothetical protein